VLQHVKATTYFGSVRTFLVGRYMIKVRGNFNFNHFWLVVIRCCLVFDSRNNHE
jgi:hypothetical protein